MTKQLPVSILCRACGYRCTSIHRDHGERAENVCVKTAWYCSSKIRGIVRLIVVNTEAQYSEERGASSSNNTHVQRSAYKEFPQSEDTEERRYSTPVLL